MPAAEQERAGCVIGRDYAAPVVDHATQRGLALALFRNAAQQADGVTA
jgi:deoxyribodipyrimidine photo-lyase